jgi:hypothetical protein
MSAGCREHDGSTIDTDETGAYPRLNLVYRPHLVSFGKKKYKCLLWNVNNLVVL